MVVSRRTCLFTMPSGAQCRAAPLRDGQYCFVHDPDHAAEAAEARRLGGLRRKREKAVAIAYDFQGLESVHQLRRVLEVAILDTLSLDNNVARNRTLGTLTMTALKALETGDLEERVAALESAVTSRADQELLFDAEMEDRGNEQPEEAN